MSLGVGITLANWASLITMLAGGLIGLLYRARIASVLGMSHGTRTVRAAWRM
jgi:hypothetical protein